MIKSKEWNWNELNEETHKEIWLEPCMESYYLLDRWKKQNKSDFLDLGCGLGRHTIQFAKAGFKTTAVDLSEVAIKNAKDWAESEKLDVVFKHADMIDLPFKNNTFDCIMCKNVISHTDTEGIKNIIKKIYDMLKDNGECFLTLGSKSANTYKNPNNPAIDSNTKIRMDDGPEKGVPHFYADIEIIKELFVNFKIEYLAQTQDFMKKDDGDYFSFWHYVLLIHKI